MSAAPHLAPGPAAADAPSVAARPARWRTTLEGAALGLMLGASLGLVGVVEVAGISTADGVLYAAVAGALAGLLRRAHWLAWAGGALLLLWLLVTMTPVAEPVFRLTHRWDVRWGEPLPQEVDAVFVLSGAVTADSTLNSDAADRLLHGIVLARDAKVPLVLSEVRGGPWKTLSSKLDQSRLLALTRFEEPVHVVTRVKSTMYEAWRVAKLAELHGWTRIAVVTSPSHSRRACATIEATGLKVTCAPARLRRFASNALRDEGDRVAAVRETLYEAAAYVKYRWMGWI